MRTRTAFRAAALGAATTLALTGCLSEGGDSAGGGGGGGGGDGTVEIMYGFSGPHSEAFKSHVGEWAEGEGIDVQFSSTPDFDKLVRSRVAGNNLPDIAIFPQPGITLDIARGGELADLRQLGLEARGRQVGALGAHDREVGAGVGRHHLARHPLAVGEAHLHLGVAADDVLVGDDDPVGAVDDAAAQPAVGGRLRRSRRGGVEPCAADVGRGAARRR